MSETKHSRNKADEKSFQDEFELIERIKAGDANAYGILVVRYQTRLLQFLYKKFGQHHMIEDVVQTAFVKGFRRLDSFQFKSKFFTWLCTIAYREMINTVLEEKRRPQILSEQHLSDDDNNFFNSLYDEDAPTIDEQIIFDEKVKMLREICYTIPEKLLTPLLLSTEDGLTYKEIAERLGVTVDSVRSRINRARAELKALIADHDLKL